MNPLVATSDGRLEVLDGHRPTARSGAYLVPLRRRDCVPLPEGTTLVHLPGRRPVVLGRGGEAVVVDGVLAVAAILPVGWVRTLLPASAPDQGARRLPLYAYTAVAADGDRPMVAAERTDTFDWWPPRRLGGLRLQAAVAAARRALPDNRLVEHLATCALDYRCYTAQNTFLRRYEGALPVSPACNADCLGCISLQSDGAVPSPQARIRFAPTPDELVAVADYHLGGARGGIVAFGQGCEGEPLTRVEALVEATRRIKAAHPQATVHLNTNGSHPQGLRRLLAAGVTSVRISAISFTPAIFAAYYRPTGYGLDEVVACGTVAHRAGAQVCLNLLTVPGLTDTEPELERTLAACRAMGVHQIQWRNLNVDHDWLLQVLPPLPRGLGLARARALVARELPGVAQGNFTRPWPQLVATEGASGPVVASGHGPLRSSAVTEAP